MTYGDKVNKYIRGIEKIFDVIPDFQWNRIQNTRSNRVYENLNNMEIILNRED